VKEDLEHSEKRSQLTKEKRQNRGPISGSTGGGSPRYAEKGSYLKGKEKGSREGEVYPKKYQRKTDAGGGVEARFITQKKEIKDSSLKEERGKGSHLRKGGGVQF